MFFLIAFSSWTLSYPNPSLPHPTPKTLKCEMSLVKCLFSLPCHLEAYLTLTLPFPTQPQDPKVWNVACKMLILIALSSSTLTLPVPTQPQDPKVWNVACKMLILIALSSWSLPHPNPSRPPPNPKTLKCGMSLVKCLQTLPFHLELYLTLTLPFPTQPQDPKVWNVACKRLMPIALSSWILSDSNPSLPHPTPRP